MTAVEAECALTCGDWLRWLGLSHGWLRLSHARVVDEVGVFDDRKCALRGGERDAGQFDDGDRELAA